jgi:prevent-host-death family protein
MNRISKSRFKARALDYFRMVERTGRPLIITDRGVPVLQIVPYQRDPGEALRALRDSVVRYESPMAPVGEEDWESAE